MNWNEQKELLKELGYNSYRDYLAGIVWANIRDKAFQVKGERCVICNRHATVLHHRAYTEEVIRGTDVSLLEPLCWDCHNQVEYDKYGHKETLCDANRKLDWYKENKDVWMKRKWSGTYTKMQKEFHHSRK